MRAWGWGLIAGGGLSLLGAGGVWMSPVKDAQANREGAFSAYVNASEGESDARLRALVQSDESLQSWQSTAVISAGAGALLSLTGAALLWLAPSTKGALDSTAKSRSAELERLLDTMKIKQKKLEGQP